MNKNLIIAGAFLLLFGGLQGNSVRAAEDNDTKEPEDCCFAHPDYQGQCIVTPAQGETCASILDYLNTPGTANKTYCGTTRIRGGWTSVECTEDQESQKIQSKSN